MRIPAVFVSSHANRRWVHILTDSMGTVPSVVTFHSTIGREEYLHPQ